MLSKPKDRRIAVLLALVGTISPISGFHKFYMGQPKWGILYLLLSATQIPRIASAVEAIWYLFQDDTFADSSSSEQAAPIQTIAVAEALRQLELLRQEGLVSEYEFEQKRRQLLDRMV